MDQNKIAGEILFNWHEFLYNNREVRAELRRCRSIDEVRMSKGFYILLNEFEKKEITFSTALKKRLAIIAMVIAKIDDLNKKSRFNIAKGLIGISETRFRNLIGKEDLNDFMLGLVRILPLINERMNPELIYCDIMYWGKKMKVSWAETYYGGEK